MSTDAEQNNEDESNETKIDLDELKSKFTDNQVKAYNKGWKPIELFEGEEDDYKTANEFLRSESLYGKINSQSSQIRKLETSLAGLRDGINKMTKMQIETMKSTTKSQIEQLRVNRNDAAEAGQSVKVEQYNDAIREAEKELEIEPEVIKDESSTGQYTEQQFKDYYQNSWIEDNNWYETDADLQTMANSFMRELHSKGSASPKETFNYVDSKMKRFLEDKPNKGKLKRTVAPRSSGRKSGRTNYSISDIPEDLRGAARNAIEMSFNSGKYKTMAEAETVFAKSFANIKLNN